MMTTMQLGTVVLAAAVLGLAPTGGLSRAQQPGISHLRGNGLGISFASTGNVEQRDSAACSMRWVSSQSSAGSALAEVAVSDMPYVDLPGSYGGRLYPDAPHDAGILRSRVLVDSVFTASFGFRREYWAVYAGMGMWEGVINCYARAGAGYCIVSLVREMTLGKPGEQVGGGTLSAKDMRAGLLAALRDSTGEFNGRFGELLASVQGTGNR